MCKFGSFTLDSVIVDASLFVGVSFHGLVVNVLVSMEFGLVDTGFCIESVLHQVTSEVKLLINICCLQ